jgi:hypothetical protein
MFGFSLNSSSPWLPGGQKEASCFNHITIIWQQKPVSSFSPGQFGIILLSPSWQPGLQNIKSIQRERERERFLLTIHPTAS